MSLALALYNHHGIIMSADKIRTSSFKKKDGTLTTINLPPTDQKLFLIENKYGLSYTGTSSINQAPLSALLERYFLDNIIGEDYPDTWLLNLANYFHPLLSNDENIVFILCGYYKNKQFVISTNTSSPNINTFNTSHDSSIVYSGESNIVASLINSKEIAYDYNCFTMQDSVDFLYFLNRTVADMMYFGQYLPTVSKECDILAIYPTNSYWVLHDSLSTLHLDV